MIYRVKKTKLTDAPINYGEIIRYAGAKSADENLTMLIDDCVKEIKNSDAVDYSVCYTVLPVKIIDDTVDFSAFSLISKNLSKRLSGASSALVFACTLSVNYDRLIKKYSINNPSRALVLQAIGAERIESFIDLFVSEYEKQNGIKLSARFSPGYGDLPLDAQKQIFALLNPQKNIGLTLNDSLIMSPSKSVTAIAGINGCTDQTGCKTCTNKTCEFRR